MGDIVTITLNPALDLTTSVGRIVPFQKLRCGPIRRDAGGGGINVARVLERWGANVLAILVAGGPTGELLKRLISAEGLPCSIIAVAADTREDFTVQETESGRQFRFVEPGNALHDAEVSECLARLQSLRPVPRFVVISGSLPPGSTPDIYARLVRSIRTLGAKAVLDASGAPLARALEAGVYLVKPNLRELTELCGRELGHRSAQIAACRELVGSGRAEITVLSLAEKGAIAVSADGVWQAAAPAIQPISTVGAGDSCLAGALWRLTSGDSVAEALRYGVAAGSASLLAPGTSLCRPDDVERLLGSICPERVSEEPGHMHG